MRNALLIFFVIAAVNPKVKAQGVTCQVTPVSSQIRFQVSHLDVLTVDGQIGIHSGEILLELTDTIKIRQVSAIIDVSTLDTGIDSRDQVVIDENHLQSKDYPFISFNSANSSILGQKLLGELQIKDISQSIALDWSIEELRSEYVIQAHTSITRKQFDLDFGLMDDLIGQKIAIEMLIRCRSED